MKKNRKLMVCVSTDEKERASMLKQLVVKLGFAKTISDAAKIIPITIEEYDLANSYFVFAQNFNLRDSPITTHRLTQLAAQGIAVIVGVKKLPREFEFFVEAFYPSDFTRV